MKLKQLESLFLRVFFLVRFRNWPLECKRNEVLFLILFFCLTFVLFSYDILILNEKNREFVAITSPHVFTVSYFSFPTVMEQQPQEPMIPVGHIPHESGSVLGKRNLSLLSLELSKSCLEDGTEEIMDTNLAIFDSEMDFFWICP
jgi:hypothetical protein